MIAPPDKARLRYMAQSTDSAPSTTDIGGTDVPADIEMLLGED